MKSLGTRSVRMFGAIPAVAIVLLLTACGGDGATDVKVSLDEWSITPGASSVKAGDIRFIVANDGAEPHEFVIIKTDLGVTALPVVDGKVDEEKVDIIDEIEPFAAGSTERKTVDLKAGKYVLICNIVERVPGEPVESHYEKGMRVAFEVTN